MPPSANKEGLTMQRLKPRQERSIDPHLLADCILFVGFFLVFWATRGSRFMKPSIFKSMMYQFPEYGLLALGVMLALICGGNDLSTVGVGNLVSILTALWVSKFVPADISGVPAVGVILLMFVSAIAIGALCGTFTAFLIHKLNIPAFIATIGTLRLYTGIGIGITDGQAVSGIPAVYTRFIQYCFFDFIPVPVILFALGALLVAFLLNKTSYGVDVRMQGSNSVAARFAGVRKFRTYLITYMVSGALAAVSGLIMLGRMSSAKSDYGTSYTLISILICILGGVSPNGGKGRTLGVLLAVLILQLVTSGMALYSSINTFYNTMIFGLLLISALIFNYYIEKAARKK